MFPSPFSTKRLLLDEKSISKQAQSTPNASQAEISLPLVKKSNPDELVSWIDSLESRVKDTLRHQNNELKQFNVEHERERAKDKYRYAVFEQSFQKLGHIVQTNSVDSEVELATEAKQTKIHESHSSVEESGNSQELSPNDEGNEVSDDSDIIEIIESEEEVPEEQDQGENQEESEEESPDEEGLGLDVESEEDVRFDKFTPQPSYFKPRLMDDRKYMTGPAHIEPESENEVESESEGENQNESEIESENENENENESEIESGNENQSEMGVESEQDESDQVSVSANDLDEVEQQPATTHAEHEYHQVGEEYQDTQNPAFHSDVIDVNFLHNPHDQERYAHPAHSSHDLNNYFESEYNHADIHHGIDTGIEYDHMDLPSHSHQDSHEALLVEEISSALEKESDNDEPAGSNAGADESDDELHGSNPGSDSDADSVESENSDHEESPRDNIPMEKSVLESIASYMTTHNVPNDDTLEAESGIAIKHNDEGGIETGANGHLQKNTVTEEHQENTAIESESEDESNSPPPPIFRTLLEHEPEEVLNQLKQTEKRFNIKLNVVSAMEEELSRISGLLGSHSPNVDIEMASAIQQAIESSQTNQHDSEMEATQNNEIQAVLDSVEHQIEMSQGIEEAEESAGIEDVSDVHIEKPILEAVPPGPEETYIDATTEIDEEDMEKNSPNVDQEVDQEADILASESEENELVSISDNTQPADNDEHNERSSFLLSPSEDKGPTPISEYVPTDNVNLEKEASRLQSEEIDDKEKSKAEEVRPAYHPDTNAFGAQSEKIEVEEIQRDEEEEIDKEGDVDTQQNSASITETVEVDVEMEDADNAPTTNMEEGPAQEDVDDCAEILVGDKLSSEQYFARESSPIDEDVQLESSTIIHEVEPVPNTTEDEQMESNNDNGEQGEVVVEVEEELEVENDEQSQEDSEIQGGNSLEKEVVTETEAVEDESVKESKVESELKNDVEDAVQREPENEPEPSVENEVVTNNDVEIEVEKEVEYAVEKDMSNESQSEGESEAEVDVENAPTDRVKSNEDLLETEAGESNLGRAELGSSITIQGIVAGDESLHYVEIEETVTDVQEVLYPSAILEPEEVSSKEDVILDRLEAEEYLSNADDEETVAVALPSVIIEADGEEVLVSNSEQSDKQAENAHRNDDQTSSDETDNHDGKRLETGESKDERNYPIGATDEDLDIEPEHEQTSGRKRHFDEVDRGEQNHQEGSTLKRFRAFVSNLFGKKSKTSSNPARNISVPRITPPTLSPVESETETEQDSELLVETPVHTKGENEDESVSGIQPEMNEEPPNSDAGANIEVNDSEAETEVSDEEDSKTNERKNRFDAEEDLETVNPVEAIQTLKKKHPRMLQGLDISEQMLQPSHSLRNGHTYGRPEALESIPEEPKLRIPKRGMKRQNVPRLIDTAIKPDEDYPAFRTRSKSPLKRSLQEIISTEEEVIAPRRRSRRVAQREEREKAPENKDENIELEGKT